jgi:hypothetical protein
MDLPRISFEVQRVSEDGDSDNKDDLDSGYSDSDDGDDSPGKDSIIKVEDIQLKPSTRKTQPPQMHKKPYA